MIYIDNGKTVKVYFTDKHRIIERAIRILLDKIEDIMSAETFNGYTLEIKESEVEYEDERD